MRHELRFVKFEDLAAEGARNESQREHNRILNKLITKCTRSAAADDIDAINGGDLRNEASEAGVTDKSWLLRIPDRIWILRLTRKHTQKHPVYIRHVLSVMAIATRTAFVGIKLAQDADEADFSEIEKDWERQTLAHLTTSPEQSILLCAFGPDATRCLQDAASASARFADDDWDEDGYYIGAGA